MKSSLLYYLHAVTPLHMGTGSAVGSIDLPHSREVSTGLPNVPGSGIKGVLRDELKSIADHTILFGADRENSTNRDQGALLFSDARLLCMPVIAYAGDFAWVTSPLALARYARERRHSVHDEVRSLVLPSPGAACVTIESSVRHNGNVYLRDIVLKAILSDDANRWATLIANDLFGASQPLSYFHGAFVSRFVVATDADFLLLTESGTDIRMRNSLSDSKTVRDGQLWSEENMPAESVFWGSIAADTIQRISADAAIASFSENMKKRGDPDGSLLQFGGKATVGRGLTRFIIAESAACTAQVPQ